MKHRTMVSSLTLLIHTLVFWLVAIPVSAANTVTIDRRQTTDAAYISVGNTTNIVIN